MLFYANHDVFSKACWYHLYIKLFPLTRIYFHCSVAWSHTQYVLSEIMWLHYVVTNLNVLILDCSMQYYQEIMCAAAIFTNYTVLKGNGIDCSSERQDRNFGRDA